MRPVATSPALSIQTAFFERMTADEPLRVLVENRVYDHVPEDQPYPYVVVGEAVVTPDNTHDCFGAQTVETIHVWSDYRGYAQALRIENRLQELFDHQPLDVPGHSVIVVRFELTNTIRDPNPRVRHVPVQFRVITEQEM